MGIEIPERLKAMTEAELRNKWRQMDFGMWEFENDPNQQGRDFLRNPGDEYMYDDMSHEADLINKELERRGLKPCERQVDEEFDSEAYFGYVKGWPPDEEDPHA